MEGSTAPQTEMRVQDILRDLLAQKIGKNPSFSLRAFARDLKVSHTYLSLVMSGKKPLSLKKVLQFTESLRLEPREAERFLKAATFEAEQRNLSGARQFTPKKIQKKISFYEIESDNFRAISDWYHLPIIDLIETKGFQSDPKWIAKRLGISVLETRSAIDRLKRLHLIRENEAGELEKAQDNVWVQSKGLSEAIRTYHHQMIEKALTAQSVCTDKDRDTRHFASVTAPVNPLRLAEAKRKIEKFRESLYAFLSEGECTELYQINLQLFQLTTSEKPKGTVLKMISKKRGSKK